MRNFKVYIDGQEYEVAVEEVGATSQERPVEVKQEVKTAPVKKAVAGGTPVKAPMEGMIKDLKVASGSTVKKGDVIYVLEAMKMDNDITAETDGVITFNVKKGENVEAETVVAFIS